MRFSKILRALAIALAALAALVFGGGMLLKEDYRVERSVVVNAPAEKIYPLLDSSKGWSSWGVWYRKDPQMQVIDTQAMQGVGAAWSWTSKSQGNGAMKLTQATPGQRVAYELSIEGFDPSTGELSLAPEGTQTKVTWVMQGRMSNTMGRWFGLFMDRLVGPDFEQGLTNLKDLAEKPQ
jgi:Polyketide cyclase / dehydrase and lipid transport